MLVRAHGFTIDRGSALHADVELDARGGLPAFSIVGLSGGAARDARERVQAALLNSGFGFPRRRLTANVAPAASPRSAPSFDLALACCVLAVQDQIDPGRLARIGLFAELGLGGDLRPRPCAAAAAQAAAAAGLAGLVVARADLETARDDGALAIVGLNRLSEVAGLLVSQSGRVRSAASGGAPPLAAADHAPGARRSAGGAVRRP